MISGLTSVVIPTYNHAKFIADAIESVLASTSPVELLVVDDGSTDETSSILKKYGDEIVVVTQEHKGPCAARNLGLERSSGEYVMFLDADDLISARKVERQVLELAENPQAGWVICDVAIEDEQRRTSTTASAQYGYANKELSGWIHKELLAGPFIPIMSPLVRRDAIPKWIRFADEKVPEDWHFWCELSTVARMRYVPEVLATYRHRKQGRSRLPKMSRRIVPTITDPLRLNLGCGTPNTRSWHPMAGMVNLDKSTGWKFEDGLTDFADGTVYGITISHALMYLHDSEWPKFFSEVSRVLVGGGVVRITEDSTRDEQSARFAGWKGSAPAVTLTSPGMVRDYLERAGLVGHDVDAASTRFSDSSLMQSQHGDAPDVFFIEGQKHRGVLFAPHNDDETLFAAFTILKYRPRVVVCYASARDYGDEKQREEESRDALSVLGAESFQQWHGGDLRQQMRELKAQLKPTAVWAPSALASHPDHVEVSKAAVEIFGDLVRFYHTYKDGQKVRDGAVVDYEPVWLGHKHRALARYESQIAHPRASQFFAWDLVEYVER